MEFLSLTTQPSKCSQATTDFVKRLIEIKMKENPTMTRKQAIKALQEEDEEE